MKKYLSALSFILIQQFAFGLLKDEFAVNLIPDSLLPGANSVVRFAETKMRVVNAGTLEYSVHRVVSVFNETGADELSMTIYYNPFRKVTRFKAFLYDKDGRLMNKRSESDLQDYAAHDGFSLFNDARVKHLQTSGGVYPVTIDYAYVIEYNGLLDYPEWRIQNSGQAVEYSFLQIDVPEEIPIKYKSFNIDLSPSIITHTGVNGYTSYLWRVTNLKPHSVPINSYNRNYFLPHVDVIPEIFEIAGYRGSFRTWRDFGISMNEMWKDKRHIPDNIRNEVAHLVEGISNKKEKAKIIYNYLQNSFRYVSIQVGIGGYIPFNVATVHSAKYGDCKALSNYMHALLSTAGIKSYPALVNAGREEHSVDTSFPGNYFNHVILFVELDDENIWLECTSNSIPFGELGGFTENRYALVFGDEGGKMTATPNSRADLNTLSANCIIQIDSNLNAVIIDSVRLKGEFRQEAKHRLVLGTEKERSYYTFNVLGIKQPENYSIENFGRYVPEIAFNIKGNSSKIYDFKSGNKIFLPGTFIKNWYENINADTSAKHDIVLSFPNTKTEKLKYILPNYSVLAPFSDYELDNAVISFKRTYLKGNNNELNILTEFSIKKNIITSSEIQILKHSLQLVSKQLQQKIIIVL